MTPEAKVKVWAKAQYDVLFPDHWRVSPRGGPFGKAGCPDDIICWRGIFIAIEVKADDGHATDLQMRALKDIGLAGGVAAILIGKDMNKLQMIRKIAMEKMK